MVRAIAASTRRTFAAVAALAGSAVSDSTGDGCRIEAQIVDESRAEIAAPGAVLR